MFFNVASEDNFDTFKIVILIEYTIIAFENFLVFNIISVTTETEFYYYYY